MVKQDKKKASKEEEYMEKTAYAVICDGFDLLYFDICSIGIQM